MSSPTRPDVSPISMASYASSSKHSPEEKDAAAGLSQLSQHTSATILKRTATGASRFNRTPAPKAKVKTIKVKAPTALMHLKQIDAEGIALPASPSADSEDVSGTSDWSAERSHESEYDSAVESHASSVRSSNGKAARGKGKQQLVQKTLKRVRGESFSAATPAKRVRSTPQSRSAPRASSASTDLIPSKFTNFTTSIFIIQLGPEGRPDCPTFHAHESVLCGSKIMALEIEKAKANRRATKQNTLPLMPHDPVAFEQMLQFLYKDRFNLTADPPKPAPPITAIERMREIHELFSLAKHYQLPNLQKQVVKLFSHARMLSKVTPATFFDWAEDMYYEELDHDVGPFKAYFSRVAPVMLREAKEETLTELYRMTAQGGGFSCELFKAALRALGQAVEQAGPPGGSKKEEPIDDGYSSADSTLFVKHGRR
ncbi:hypothetical protein N7G274_009490 [Stereocaulon virgatum]|uniref:BTB domain-containing protein n=1 Tax=Stereocaulon virgatum TaxID=373712 RepID=A0ABR3ZX71_9LECA